MLTRHWNGEYWYENRATLAQRIKKWFWWQPLKDDTPISLFGHRITFQWFGVDLCTRRWGYFCIRWREREPDPKKLRAIYISPNATPWAATDWYYGAPYGVRQAAEKRTPGEAAPRDP
jgi:hypothetical protein